MGTVYPPISADANDKLLACYTSGLRAAQAFRKVAVVSRATVYLRYAKWKRDGVSRSEPSKPKTPPRKPKGSPRKPRVHGGPKPYTGPTWIGKAITK